jgi:acyl carrier protein
MDQVLQRVITKIGEVVALSPDEISPDSSLVDELGADSLDFVELMYLIEHEFGVRFDKDDMSLAPAIGLSEEAVEEKGIVTSEALKRLREKFPAFTHLLKDGMPRRLLASLITPRAIADSVNRKIEEKTYAQE